MKYMLLIYDDPAVWEKFTQQEFDGIMAEYVALREELRGSGKMIAGAKLQPATTATTVRMRSGKRLVHDGPFAETREHLGGFYVIEARDLDEAMAIAARMPSAKLGTVEVRPVDENLVSKP